MEILYIQLNDLHVGTLCKYWNRGPQLRSLAFPTLFSELLSHLWSIPHTLLLSHTVLYCLGPQANWKFQMQQGPLLYLSFISHYVFYRNGHVRMHSFIHYSTNIDWESLMYQNPFDIDTEKMNYTRSPHL